MKIDLDIDPKIPQDVRDIIARAETSISLPAFKTENAGTLAHIISQIIQQAYFLGCIDGSIRTQGVYVDALANLGKPPKAVQS